MLEPWFDSCCCDSEKNQQSEQPSVFFQDGSHPKKGRFKTPNEGMGRWKQPISDCMIIATT